MGFQQNGKIIAPKFLNFFAMNCTSFALASAKFILCKKVEYTIKGIESMPQILISNPYILATQCQIP